MVQTSYIVVRTTIKTRDNFNNLCKSAGIKSTDAIRLIISKIILNDDILFNFNNIEVSDDINSEAISISFRVPKEQKEKFKLVCDNHNISYSTVIRAFMMSSIATKSLDFK